MQIELLSHTPDPEGLIETAARVCYASEQRGPEARAKLIAKLIDSHHDSVLEHASASFLISGISRACSHQLVRHRLASYSQESQRHVKPGDHIEWVVPPAVEGRGVIAVDAYTAVLEEGLRAYHSALAHGYRKEDARLLLPQAMPTRLVMTANFRQWRHVLAERLSPQAQWEIRGVAERLRDELRKIAPLVFGA